MNPEGISASTSDELGSRRTGVYLHKVRVRPGEDVRKTIVEYSSKQGVPVSIFPLSASGYISRLFVEQQPGDVQQLTGNFKIIDLDGQIDLVNSAGTVIDNGDISVILTEEGKEKPTVEGNASIELIAASLVDVEIALLPLGSHDAERTINLQEYRTWLPGLP